jgi:hypothetical protein
LGRRVVGHAYEHNEAPDGGFVHEAVESYAQALLPGVTTIADEDLLSISRSARCPVIRPPLLAYVSPEAADVVVVERRGYERQEQPASDKSPGQLTALSRTEGDVKHHRHSNCCVEEEQATSLKALGEFVHAEVRRVLAVPADDIVATGWMMLR